MKTENKDAVKNFGQTEIQFKKREIKFFTSLKNVGKTTKDNNKWGKMFTQYKQFVFALQFFRHRENSCWSKLTLFRLIAPLAQKTFERKKNDKRLNYCFDSPVLCYENVVVFYSIKKPIKNVEIFYHLFKTKNL